MEFKWAAKSYRNGHEIITTTSNPNEWVYADDLQSISCGERPCVKCSKYPTTEGHDACLGKLTGVQNACCGHGVEEGYIQFDDGKVIRFSNSWVDSQ